MKRLFNALIALTIALTLAGICAYIFSGKSILVSENAVKYIMGAAIISLMASLIFRPRAYQASFAKASPSSFKSAGKVENCGFSSVAANHEAKNSLMGLVDYLKTPEKYAQYGARMPKGVLLYGPPGTGKTLLARALAGEAKVPFFALSGSDFVQMYVGVGASRVRELFKNARKAGKCVIFIDEIDAMGKKRGDSSSDERDQTLNALLSEMSGFDATTGIIVIAATNRLDTLDPALLRPGRFDRQIEVGLPDKTERLSILKLHSKNKPLAGDIDLESLAADTCSFSGASLETLLNEAAIAAAKRGADAIEDKDIRGAFIKTIAGEDRQSSAHQDEKCVIALHEAGHALAIKKLMPENEIRRVSILPSGNGAAGYSLSIPPERAIIAKRHMENQVMVLLAGRAAELLLGGDDALTAGAANDLTRAAELISGMVMDLGMEGSPAVAMRALSRACGASNDAYARCEGLLNKLYGEVYALLSENTEPLLALAKALMESEVLSGEQVSAILADNVSSESLLSTNV